MARQATMNSAPDASLNGMLNGIGDLASNVVTLTTLQAQLAAQDFQESSRRAAPALVAAAVLIPIGFASVTAGLFGLAYELAGRLGMSLGQALLVESAAGIVIAACLSALVIRRIHTSVGSFRRSREELERNIAWLRTVLLHSGR